jgi:hypothetical protein
VGELGQLLGGDLVAGPGQVDGDGLADAGGRGRQDQDAVGQVDRLVDVVGDQQDREAGAVPHLEQQVLQVGPGLSVHRRERLVQQQDLGLVGEGAGDGCPLLHPARQLPRVLAALRAQADRGEGVAGQGLALGLGQPRRPQR